MRIINKMLLQSSEAVENYFDQLVWVKEKPILPEGFQTLQGVAGCQ